MGTQHRFALVLLAGFLMSCSGSDSPLLKTVDGNGWDLPGTDTAGDDAAAAMDVLEEVAPDLPLLDIVLPDDGEAWVEDAGPEPGSFGWPCDEPSDCLSGYCVETAQGKVCSTNCQEECPENWACVQDMSSRPDLVFVCLPLYSRLCLPCHADADCRPAGSDTGALCVDHGAEGSFCGAACDLDTPCPDGYDCLALTDAEDTPEQCFPAGGAECGCSALAVQLGATTECFVESEVGTCIGQRVCSNEGLSDCDAPTPAEEVCNGLDDDCDGAFDEELGETSCGLGICQHTVANCANGEAVQCDPFAGAKTEACNGEDDDCDGETDEGFEDADDDGIADCMTDDDDGDGVVDGQDNCPATPNPGQENQDFDGQGDACDDDDDNDQIPDDLDCAPLDAEVHPGAQETCNGIDDDCDGDVDEGLGETTCGIGPCVHTVANCMDGAPQTCDPLELADEEVCDGADNDCDGATDETFPNADGDLFADCVDQDDDNDGKLDDADNCPLVPNPQQLDGDKDGLGDACDEDADGDGVTDGQDNCPEVANPEQSDTDGDGLGDLCDGDDDGDGDPDVVDCAPLDAAISHFALEACNGQDDDCDGQSDEANAQGCQAWYTDVDSDGYGVAGQVKCLCGPEDFYTTQETGDCKPLEETVYPGADETCDGLDNNCDGQTDEGMATLACGLGECFHTVYSCIDGKVVACDPLEGALPELCDGLDNDCDNELDEELEPITCGQGVCVHTVPSCLDGEVQACDPWEGAGEEICDGLDNDCDGDTDEDQGQTTCGVGPCLHTVANCAGGQAQDCDPLEGAVEELCDGLDQDCDGVSDNSFPDTDDDGEADCVDADDDGDGDPDDVDCEPLEPTIGPSQEEVCWSGIDEDCNPATEDECPLESCQALHGAAPGLGDGTYTIDPDGDGPLGAIDVYCDMTTDGGGWTGFMPIQAYEAFGGTMVVLEQADIDGIDESGRPYTSDLGGQHTYHYTFNVPFGFSEFYLKDYFIKANSASNSYVSDLTYTDQQWYQTLWTMAHAGGGVGDVSFGSGAADGPTTSYNKVYEESNYALCPGCTHHSGVCACCTSCEIAWPGGATVYPIADAPSTQFRMGWGEKGGEYEGWYPWWSGLVMLR